MASNYFDAASQGYVNVQQQIAQMGLLGGSMQPMDGRGAAVQIPTMPPPQFTATIATTGAFMPGAPAGAPASIPQALPYGVSIPQTQTSFSAPPIPPMQSMAPPPMPMPQFMPYPGPPPTVMPMPIGGLNAGGIGGVMSDMAIAGGHSMPGFTGGLIRARADAASRNYRRFGDTVGKGLEFGAMGAGLAASLYGVGAAVTGTGVGAKLGIGITAAATALYAGERMMDTYNRQRKNVRRMQTAFSGLSTGEMLDPTGLGITNAAGKELSLGMSRAARSLNMNTSTLMSFTEGAESMGLLRGHTNRSSDVVSRVKSLAAVARSITQLGEGISAADALEMQALINEMGMAKGTDLTAIGRKLVTAARVTGSTLGNMTAAASHTAGAYSSMGMSGIAGLQTGAKAIVQGQALAEGGSLTSRQLARMGGASGISNTLAQTQAAFDAQTAMPMVYGAMMLGKDGKFTIDQNRLEMIASGEISLKEAEKRGRDFLSGKSEDSRHLTKAQRSSYYPRLELNQLI